MDAPGKRIVIFSAAPWANTGYGQQTAQLAPRLKAAGHDVAIAAMWGLNGNSLNWNDIPVYPSDEYWGNLRLADYAQMFKPDLVITLVDVHVFKDPRLKELPLASWVPVDHKPVPPAVANYFPEFGARPIAMSRFGEAELKDVGLDPVYVPHGIDTTVFAPKDREQAKKMLNLDGKFVVGMVANNAGHTPSRKAFPQALFAFSRFRLAHPDAMLYLHTDMTGKRSPSANGGVHIPSLLARYEIPPEAVTYTDPVAMDLGIPPQTMATMYSAFDVLLNPSYGEGFGIPVVEAQACGTPVIVTDWTAMTELCGAGWLVGGEVWDDVQHGAFYRSPSMEDIYVRLSEAYEARDDQGIRELARSFAEQYDADRVFAEHWQPALEQLTRPREVAPLPGINREMRRKMAKAGKREVAA